MPNSIERPALDSTKYATPIEIVFVAQVTATAWTDMPSALTEFVGNTRHRRRKNLSNVTEWRLAVHMTIAGVAGSKMGVQYSIDAGTTWKGLDNGTAATQSTNVLALDQGTNISLVSSWAAINSEARINDCLLRITGNAGDGVIDPTFLIIALEVR